MGHEEMSAPYLEAIRRGFHRAHDLGQACGPVHLLVGVAEGDGPAAAALDPGQGRSLLAVVTANSATQASEPSRSPYGGLGHLHMQAQGAAMSLAEARSEPVKAEHLLIALLDQATSPVLDALRSRALTPSRSGRRRRRRSALPGCRRLSFPR